MQIGLLSTYLLTLLIATITPGPGMLLAFNHGLRFGVRKSLVTALGVTLAAFLQASIALAGLGTILIQSEIIYHLVKTAGAVYLIYLGVKMFFSRSEVIGEEVIDKVQTKNSLEILRESFLIGIGNPKAIVFFTALFPQFISSEINQSIQYTVMVSSVSVISFLGMILYSFFGARMMDFFMKKTVQSIFNKVTGGIFVGLGAMIAVEE